MKVVSKKAKLTYFDAYLSQTMWNQQNEKAQKTNFIDLTRQRQEQTPKNTKTPVDCLLCLCEDGDVGNNLYKNSDCI